LLRCRFELVETRINTIKSQSLCQRKYTSTVFPVIMTVADKYAGWRVHWKESE
jgi:hypothetical protein